MKEKLVIATTNKNKVERIKNLLKETNFEVVSISDMIFTNIKEPSEIADNGLDNAIEKAAYYVNYKVDDAYEVDQDFFGIDSSIISPLNSKGIIISFLAFSISPEISSKLSLVLIFLFNFSITSLSFTKA